MSIPAKIPDFIVHYSRGEPFRSITSRPSETWPQVIAELNETNAWGLSRFTDPNYLKQRLEVETKIHSNFIKLGGQPELLNPIYFFLGRNERFEEHKANNGYKIYLKDLPNNSVSFTYGDSLLALHEENRKLVGRKYENSLCEKLYVLSELPKLFESLSFPAEEVLHIEAQLWIQPPKDIVKPFSVHP